MTESGWDDSIDGKTYRNSHFSIASDNSEATSTVKYEFEAKDICLLSGKFKKMSKLFQTAFILSLLQNSPALLKIEDCFIIDADGMRAKLLFTNSPLIQTLNIL
jgi:hypothetical protein